MMSSMNPNTLNKETDQDDTSGAKSLFPNQIHTHSLDKNIQWSLLLVNYKYNMFQRVEDRNKRFLDLGLDTDGTEIKSHRHMGQSCLRKSQGNIQSNFIFYRFNPKQ